LSLVPLPAAMIATATRGSDGNGREEARPGDVTALDAGFFFDFFIRPNIPRPRGNGYFPTHRIEFRPVQNRLAPSCAFKYREESMPKYVIERDIPGVGDVTPDQVIAISQKSCSVLNNLGPQIQWLHSYVTQDKIYCVYIAPNEEMVREHARQGGFPANRVSEVKLVIDPTSAEA